jgi:hypothetical protein
MPIGGGRRQLAFNRVFIAKCNIHPIRQTSDKLTWGPYNAFFGLTVQVNHFLVNQTLSTLSKPLKLAKSEGNPVKSQQILSALKSLVSREIFLR